METKPLERFATWARRELLTAVEARATAVLSAGSLARTERAAVVKSLEDEITRHGQKHVVDKIAYTWFNRIIALRFMDARNYTDAGVVSPPKGQLHGQPEILADAKRGNLDTEAVASTRAASAIIGLLDGTRRSTDAEGEAYALLLTEYCRYWNKAMPFMFEREDDYTELLVPANLLADGAVLSRVVEVLTEDVCDDVEVIGWLYQFYISERKDEVFAGFKKKKKAGADEIPAATQLFTPHWIVRYLVENSLGRLWMLNSPSSRLVDQMEYYIAPVGEETNFLKISKPEELTVIDPACGSGHMLTYAFDLLYAIYEEQGYTPSEIPGLILANNLYGTEIDPRAGALAAFALTIKARAKQRTFFNKQIEPNICVLDPISFSQEELDFLVPRGCDRREEGNFWNQFAEADTFGSLIRPDSFLAHRLTRHLETLDNAGDMLKADVLHWAERVIVQAEYLAPKYSIVVSNPPYMGSGNMSAPLSAWIKEAYPDEKQDLYACFVVRCDELAVSRGYVAMVTGDTWMTIKSFEKLRRSLLEHHSFLSFVHMHDVSNHPDIFGANTAFVIGKDGRPDTEGTYIYLDTSSSEVKAQHLRDAAQGRAPERVFLAQSAQFEEVPGAPLVFRLSADMRKTFVEGSPLGGSYSAMNGMTTGENARFLRLWHEVSLSRVCFTATDSASAGENGAKWFPYNKGGAYRKWYGNAEYVINWEGDGRDVIGHGRAFTRGRRNYFKPMVSWGKVSSGLPSFRLFPAGFLFDVAGTSMFADSPDDLFDALAFCNSMVAERLLAALSPTLNYESGQIASLPVIRDKSGRAAEIAKNLVSISREDWHTVETSWGFQKPALLAHASDGMTLGHALAVLASQETDLTIEAKLLEEENNALLIEIYGLTGEVDAAVESSRVSLYANPEYRFGAGKTSLEYAQLLSTTRVIDLVSYAVGCMFGRYSLDMPGIILADQGAILQDYLSKVPSPHLLPDADNVIPVVDGAWFEDDIVERFRQFLRVAFGEEHFEENLRLVEVSLGVKTLRDYFITKAGKSKFYDDHVQRYKKRPIYWLFSSPEGSFNALIYMQRYTTSTVSTVLNEYLREYRGKLENALQHAEREAAGDASDKAQKDTDRIRKILAELRDYEHDVLYPLATQQVSIDLDDGVKANYPKLGRALKPIKGLEVVE
ncbi:restriction endonuclease [Arthrobacter sp. 7749]|nr:restriction endonuclease [Arthrobacter sp. 7749]